MVGWTAIALVNMLVVAIFRQTTAGLSVQIVRHVYDFAQHAALGVISFGLVEVWLRWGPKRPGLGWLAVAVVALWVGIWMLPEDTSILARKLAVAGPIVFWHGLLVASASMGPVVGALVGRKVAQTRVRFLVMAAALAIAALNHFVVSHDYPGMHFFAAWTAAIAFATALSSWPAGATELGGRTRLASAVVLVVATCWSLLIPPG